MGRDRLRRPDEGRLEGPASEGVGELLSRLPTGGEGPDADAMRAAAEATGAQMTRFREGGGEVPSRIAARVRDAIGAEPSELRLEGGAEPWAAVLSHMEGQLTDQGPAQFGENLRALLQSFQGGTEQGETGQADGGQGATDNPLTPEALDGGGEPLTRLDHWQTVFGLDLSHVRVHTGQSDALQGAEGAAVGANVVLSGGANNPQLLAHELVHVAQNEVHGAAQSGQSQPGDASENEAEGLAQRAMRGQFVPIDSPATGQVAFFPGQDGEEGGSDDSAEPPRRESGRQQQQQPQDDEPATRQRIRRDTQRARGAIDEVRPGASTTAQADVGSVPDRPGVTAVTDNREYESNTPPSYRVDDGQTRVHNINTGQQGTTTDSDEVLHTAGATACAPLAIRRRDGDTTERTLGHIPADQSRPVPTGPVEEDHDPAVYRVNGQRRRSVGQAEVVSEEVRRASRRGGDVDAVVRIDPRAQDGSRDDVNPAFHTFPANRRALADQIASDLNEEPGTRATVDDEGTIHVNREGQEPSRIRVGIIRAPLDDEEEPATQAMTVTNDGVALNTRHPNDPSEMERSWDSAATADETAPATGNDEVQRRIDAGDYAGATERIGQVDPDAGDSGPTPAEATAQPAAPHPPADVTTRVSAPGEGGEAPTTEATPSSASPESADTAPPAPPGGGGGASPGTPPADAAAPAPADGAAAAPDAAAPDAAAPDAAAPAAAPDHDAHVEARTDHQASELADGHDGSAIDVDGGESNTRRYRWEQRGRDLFVVRTDATSDGDTTTSNTEVEREGDDAPRLRRRRTTDADGTVVTEDARNGGPAETTTTPASGHPVARALTPTVSHDIYSARREAATDTDENPDAVAHTALGEGNEHVDGHATAGRARAAANAGVAVEGEGLSEIAVNLTAGAEVQLQVADFELSFTSGDLVRANWFRQAVKFEFTGKLTASLAASAEGEVGLTANANTSDGLGLGANASFDAKAAAEGGFQLGAKMLWQPPNSGDGWQDIVGATIGVAGWAGAAVTANFDAELATSGVVLEGKFGAAIGYGGSTSFKIKVNPIGAGLMGFAMIANGIADGLEGLGHTYRAQALRRWIDSMYADDGAHAIIASNEHLRLDGPKRADLINRLLDSRPSAPHQQDVVSIIRTASHTATEDGNITAPTIALAPEDNSIHSARRAVVEAVPGSASRILAALTDQTAAGQFQAMAEAMGIEMPDSRELWVARVNEGQHRGWAIERVHECINALGTGPTETESRALFHVFRDRVADLSSWFGQAEATTVLAALSEYYRTATYSVLYVHDAPMPSGVNRNRVARALVFEGLHVHANVVNNNDKLQWTFDGLLSEQLENSHNRRAVARFLREVSYHNAGFINASVVRSRQAIFHLSHSMTPAGFASVLAVWFRRHVTNIFAVNMHWGGTVAVTLVNEHHLHRDMSGDNASLRQFVQRFLRSGQHEAGIATALFSLMIANRSQMQQVLTAPMAYDCHRKMRTDHGRNTIVALYVAEEVAVPPALDLTVTAAVIRAGAQHGIEVQIAQGNPIERLQTALDADEQQDVCEVLRQGNDTLWSHLTLALANRVVEVCEDNRGEMMARLRLHSQASGYRITPPNYSPSAGASRGDTGILGSIRAAVTPGQVTQISETSVNNFYRHYRDISTLTRNERFYLLDITPQGHRTVTLLRADLALAQSIEGQSNSRSAAVVLGRMNESQLITAFGLHDNILITAAFRSDDDAFKARAFGAVIAGNLFSRLSDDNRWTLINYLRDHTNTVANRERLYNLIQPMEASRAVNIIHRSHLMFTHMLHGDLQNQARVALYYRKTVPGYHFANMRSHGWLCGSIMSEAAGQEVFLTAAEVHTLFRALPGGNADGVVRALAAVGEDRQGVVYTQFTDVDWRRVRSAIALASDRDAADRLSSLIGDRGGQMTDASARGTISRGEDSGMSVTALRGLFDALRGGRHNQENGNAMRLLLDRHQNLRTAIGAETLLETANEFSGNTRNRLLVLLIRKNEISITNTNLPNSALAMLVENHLAALDAQRRHEVVAKLLHAQNHPDADAQQAVVTVIRGTQSGLRALMHGLGWRSVFIKMTEGQLCFEATSILYRNNWFADRLCERIWQNRRLEQVQITVMRMTRHRQWANLGDHAGKMMAVLCIHNEQASRRLIVNFLETHRQAVGPRMAEGYVTSFIVPLRLTAEAEGIWRASLIASTQEDGKTVLCRRATSEVATALLQLGTVTSHLTPAQRRLLSSRERTDDGPSFEHTGGWD